MNLDQYLSQLRDDSGSLFTEGVTIDEKREIPSPDDTPLEGQHWLKLDDVTCLFIDMIKSTALSVRKAPESVGRIYGLFTGTVVRILKEFGAQYVDVRGDAAFGLFTGDAGAYRAFAAAVTAKTFIELHARPMAARELPDFELASHSGIQSGRLLVKKIGLRGEMQNEVWAGRPVNVASTLASVGGKNELLVSSTVYDRLSSEYVRLSCGCSYNASGDRIAGNKQPLWRERAVEEPMFGFTTAHVLQSNWCPEHGEEYCRQVLAIADEH